ncbi:MULTISPECIES: serine hydrolase [Cyanophyceae]|uniref:serine hydrolase domain-containing protein n=1 Tax=Cyanophyceae TaxID=3028117 RepID=UPI00016DCE49|nr:MULTISPECIES: serine hydrolase domain-containing protein [Cyanophyceae]ACB00586.1 beta-lactamase [Picosynechococcus sp. PCC 7002]
MTFPIIAKALPDQKINQYLAEHYTQYQTRENFSGIQLSVKVNEAPTQTYVIGRESHDPNSAPITAESLFHIGSITKSFTAALLLQNDRNQALDLNADFTQYLPEYSHWSGIITTQLLNMTSGLPNYTDSPTVNYLLSQDLEQFWEKRSLIDFVYPQHSSAKPPLRSGYDYNNTGYLLSALLLETVTEKSFANLITEQLLQPYELENTFYPVPNPSAAVQQRLVEGYNFNPYTNPELVGKDVSRNNLSWAGAAGALVSNTEDIIHWVRTLFIEDNLLSAEEKEEMQQIVSLQTGEAIAQTTATDPYGFGLGIIQGYDERWGNYWFYQGETLGYRSFYVYFPCNQVIISALFNSSVDAQNNHARSLIQQVYGTLLEDDPALICQT